MFFFYDYILLLCYMNNVIPMELMYYYHCYCSLNLIVAAVRQCPGPGFVWRVALQRILIEF